ncbi:type II toxin-antitoxin system RelE/ParE family toxin [Rhizobium sp. XQZ8]|nr:type II toxin-antitoxin system RelE/ParE family toxin [Rhizobium populisoli]
MIDIGRKIAQDNPVRALSFMNELEVACQGLGAMPESYEIIGQQHGNDVRRRIHGNYLIVYETWRGQVDIMRVFHGSRDYRKILFPSSD